MSEMKTLDQYLKLRKPRWYYVRRVPLRYADVDTRRNIKTALKTSSREVARAFARGYIYTPVEEMAVQKDMTEVIDRLRTLEGNRSRYWDERVRIADWWTECLFQLSS